MIFIKLGYKETFMSDHYQIYNIVRDCTYKVKTSSF